MYFITDTFKTIMSLPIYPSLNDKQIKFIFDKIKNG